MGSNPDAVMKQSFSIKHVFEPACSIASQNALNATSFISEGSDTNVLQARLKNTYYMIENYL